MSLQLLALVIVGVLVVVFPFAARAHRESNKLDRELSIPETGKSGLWVPPLFAVCVVVALYLFLYH